MAHSSRRSNPRPPFIHVIACSLALAGMATPALSQSLVWERTWGGPQFEQAEGVAVAPDGSVYLAGQTTSFGTGVDVAAEDIFLIKYSSTGSIIWQRTYGEPPSDPNVSAADFASDVEVGGDGSIVVTGQTGSGLVLLLKFDSDGNLIWERSFSGGTFDNANGMALAPDGSTYVVGISFPPEGPTDALIIKVNSDGNPLWQRTWGGGSTDVAHDVAVASDGNIYVAGTNNSFFGDDAHLLKLSPDGSVIWERNWRAGVTGGNSAAHGVAVGLDQSVYITGRASLASGQDVFLVQFTPDGNVAWERTWDGGSDTANRVAVGPSGNIFVTGRTGVGAGGGDAFLLEFLPNGKVRSASTWGGQFFENAQDIAIGADGNVFVATVTDTPPPYVFQDAPRKASKLNSSFLGTPTGTLTILNQPFDILAGTVLTPNGSETFAGTTEAGLLNIAPEPPKKQPILGAAAAHSSAAPEYSSLRNSPNPFSAGTEVRFRLDRDENVTMTVFDVRGRKVTTLATGQYEAGEHRLAWDGSNSARRALPAGVYFVQLKTATGIQHHKMVLMRR